MCGVYLNSVPLWLWHCVLLASCWSRCLLSTLSLVLAKHVTVRNHAASVFLSVTWPIKSGK